MSRGKFGAKLELGELFASVFMVLELDDVHFFEPTTQPLIIAIKQTKLLATRSVGANGC